jgi:glycerophosphoryl diester phosphodiesterase
MKLIVSILVFLSQITLMAQKPIIQGHRGCRGEYPENTLPAFQHALEMGVEVLEMDVCISADGQVLVSHEPYMNSLYAIKPDGTPVLKSEENALNVFKMNYSEVRKFDVGSHGNSLFPEQKKVYAYKPLLEEVFQLAENFRKKTGKKIYYNIEIKSDPKEYGISQPATVDEFSEKVWAIMAKHVHPEFIILQSFDFNVLKYWNKSIQSGHFSRVDLSALVTRKAPAITCADLGFTPAIYSPNFTSLTKDIVNDCHANGMKVIPWTVNELADVKAMIQIGVDEIITDYPSRTLKNL